MGESEFSSNHETGDLSHGDIKLPPVPPLDDLRIGAPTPHSRDVKEPQVQRPQAPRVSENAGRAAVKGAAKPTDASTGSHTTESSRQYLVPKVEDILDGQGQRDVAEPKEVLEGTIEDKRGQAFDKPLSEEQQVLLVGKHAKDMDEAAKEVLKTRMEKWHAEQNALEKKGEQPRRAEVLAAHFKAGFESSLEQHEPKWYHARNARGVEGFLRSLTPKQLAEATARAVTVDDSEAFSVTHDVTRTVVKALQKEERDPATGELVDYVPPIGAELREGMQFYRDGRHDPKDKDKYPEAKWTLGDDKIDKLDLAKNATVMERNGEARDKVTSFLETAFDPDDPKVARTNHAKTSAPPHVQDGQDTGDRVRIIHVGVNGDGAQAEALSKLLAHALPFSVGANSPLGMPDAVYLSGVENAPPDAIRRILEKCQEQDVPVIMTASKVTEEMAEVLSGSAVGVSQITPATANVLSEMLDKVRREFTRSASLGWSGGNANAEDKGRSANHDANPDVPTSVARTKSRNKSTNEGIDISYTTEVDHNAALASAAELRLVERGQIAVIGSASELHGLHEISTRVWRGPFPPPDQKPYGEFLQEINERFKAIRAEVLQARGLPSQSPKVLESALGTSAIEGSRSAVAERPAAVFTVPPPRSGRLSAGFSMPVMSNRATDRSGLPDVRGLMSGNGRVLRGDPALYDLRRGYERLRGYSASRNPGNFGQYCIQRYVMALRSGQLGNVSLIDWAASVNASGYVNRHLRVGGYSVDDPYFWHHWFRDHPNCARWAREYQADTDW